MAVVTPERRSAPVPAAGGRSPEERLRATVLHIVVAASGAAAALHFANAPGHFDHSWSHGAFFAVVGVLQLAWAVAVYAHPSRRVVGLAVLNVVVIAVWVLSRTVGLPSDEAEGVGLPDGAATVFEAMVVLGALALYGPHGVRVAAAPRPTFTAAVVAVGILATAAAGMTPRYAHPAHEQGHDDHGAAAGGAVGSGDTPCERAGPPASPAQVTDEAGHSHRGPVPQEELDAATRDVLVAQQAAARTVVARYPTVADAEAAGYRMSTVYVPCIGAHYTNPALVARFDPAAPSELLFDGTRPDSKLVGLSYLVYHPGGAPDGFAGPNDIWHQHNANGGLCFNAGNVVIGSENMSRVECEGLGGHKAILQDLWMVHDWVVPGWECGWGVFAPECPELGGRVGGTAFDPPDPSATQADAVEGSA